MGDTLNSIRWTADSFCPLLIRFFHSLQWSYNHTALYWMSHDGFVLYHKLTRPQWWMDQIINDQSEPDNLRSQSRSKYPLQHNCTASFKNNASKSNVTWTTHLFLLCNISNWSSISSLTRKKIGKTSLWNKSDHVNWWVFQCSIAKWAWSMFYKRGGVEKSRLCDITQREKSF